MNKLFAALALATLAVASPVAAQTNTNFVGPRVELNAGITDVNRNNNFNDVSYSGAVGVDVGLGDRVTVGVEANASDVFDSTGRTFGVAGRLGVALNPNVLVFGRAGYTNINDRFDRKLDGIAVGGGVNFALTPNLYGNVEYRYSDVQNGVRTHGGLLGVGLRF